jgi:hypothetical protein
VDYCGGGEKQGHQTLPDIQIDMVLLLRIVIATY